MMTRLSVLAYLALPLCSGCVAGLAWTPAEPRQVERSRIAAEPFETVWARAVAWFATNNVPIDKINKESGLITAERQLPSGEETPYLDYGKVKTTGLAHHAPRVSTWLTMNIVLASVPDRPEADPHTTVTINVFGRFQARTRDANGIVTMDGTAESTGVLEKSVLDQLAGNSKQ